MDYSHLLSKLEEEVSATGSHVRWAVLGGVSEEQEQRHSRFEAQGDPGRAAGAAFSAYIPSVVSDLDPRQFLGYSVE